MLATVRRPARLRGSIELPGDKSISHRALILNAVADGPGRVEGISAGADVESTAACLRALGVEVDSGLVRGVGLRGLVRPASPLDCGNSGTTMRFLAGLLAGQAFGVTLLGDESLARRPMDRIAEPLRRMGAIVETAPLRVGGGSELRGIDFESPVASAQVKSALLLAGLYASGPTSVSEPFASRNHTELMLAAMGAPVAIDGCRVEIRPPDSLQPLNLRVPADFSSAAFWLVAAALHPDARLQLPGVGVNPSRTGLLELLARAGITYSATGRRPQGLEPVADLEVATASRRLRSLAVGAQESALAIDELPILAVAATQFSGTTRIRGAGELRVKEADRIAAMAVGLRAMGADLDELPDGLEIRGPRPLEGARVASRGDHRVAMALAVAGLLAGGRTEIEDADCVEISYPGFWDHVLGLGGLC